ncbi:MAG: hypothetical protein KJ804_17155 [Proteobacteria bacterium]|nr:hypothetical protein [Pseudomonadota bacterium]MBU1060034.1 hypothetical protein [Pseudomonadota bacterium]
MSVAIPEIATNTAMASTMTGEAVNSAKNSSTKVNNLGKAAREISKVINSVNEIVSAIAVAVEESKHTTQHSKFLLAALQRLPCSGDRLYQHPGQRTH